MIDGPHAPAVDAGVLPQSPPLASPGKATTNADSMGGETVTTGSASASTAARTATATLDDTKDMAPEMSYMPAVDVQEDPAKPKSAEEDVVQGVQENTETMKSSLNETALNQRKKTGSPARPTITITVDPPETNMNTSGSNVNVNANSGRTNTSVHGLRIPSPTANGMNISASNNHPPNPPLQMASTPTSLPPPSPTFRQSVKKIAPPQPLTKPFDRTNPFEDVAVFAPPSMNNANTKSQANHIPSSSTAKISQRGHQPANHTQEASKENEVYDHENENVSHLAFSKPAAPDDLAAAKSTSRRMFSQLQPLSTGSEWDQNRDLWQISPKPKSPNDHTMSELDVLKPSMAINTESPETRTEASKPGISPGLREPHTPVQRMSLSSPATEASRTINTTSAVASNRSKTVTQAPFYPEPQPSPKQEMIVHRSDPDQEEQNLFESRLKEDPLGVAIRKINQNGKSQLRYVKCVAFQSSPPQSQNKRMVSSASTSIQSSMSRSVGLSRDKKRFHKRHGNTGANGAADDSQNNLLSSAHNKRQLALTWGNKSRVMVSLDKFTCVRKGKTTDRTKRNPCPASQLLSVLTEDAAVTLDIEAPTKLDRDKFARAFARFLCVPLESDVDGSEVIRTSATVSDFKTPSPFKKTTTRKKRISSAHTAPEKLVGNSKLGGVGRSKSLSKKGHPGSEGNPTSPGLAEGDNEFARGGKVTPMGVSRSVASTRSTKEANGPRLTSRSNASTYLSGAKSEADARDQTHQLSDEQRHVDSELRANGDNDGISPNRKSSILVSDDAGKREATGNNDGVDYEEDEDEQSTVSSLTAGFEQEIVEELHQVIHDLRNELEASRAEAARAVKVAEQAIQSAESCSSNDWNSTVTHKAAEAAAQAQKRSAEAMARQRLAEEKLAGERRAAAFWRRQAEAAEEDAGILQTRAAAAEVQRALIQHDLNQERRRAEQYASQVKEERISGEQKQRDALNAALDKSRNLEVHIETMKLDLAMKTEESKALQEQLLESKSALESTAAQGGAGGVGVMMKLARRGRKKKKSIDPEDRSFSREPSSQGLLADASSSHPPLSITTDLLTTEKIGKLHGEASGLRHDFEVLRKAAQDEMQVLKESAAEWGIQMTQALESARAETSHLREQISLESSLRRKLHHQVLDYRGMVRVYVRPRPVKVPGQSVLSVPSYETLVVDKQAKQSEDALIKGQNGEEDFKDRSASSVSFEFDRVFSADIKQREVYDEIEELVLSALDGYSVCLMAYGQNGSGKTYTLLGDYSSTEENMPQAGVHLQALQHLFAISKQRSEKYKDRFTMTVLEVKDERLCDLVAKTQTGIQSGEPLGADIPASKRRNNRARRKAVEELQSATKKLEIKTNFDGDTVVQGLTSVPIENLSDVRQLWEECNKERNDRLSAQGVDVSEHTATCHTIFTVQVVSTNIATGVASVGKLQFVDLAGSDLIPKKASSSANKSSNIIEMCQPELSKWQYANKSLNTLSEVVDAKCQFVRNVPYRNSTLTHLLRDAFEGDAKVLMFLCISSDAEDVDETYAAIRFAQRMKRVSSGVATKHTVTVG